jgi:hypothetical protein
MENEQQCEYCFVQVLLKPGRKHQHSAHWTATTVGNFRHTSNTNQQLENL